MWASATWESWGISHCSQLHSLRCYVTPSYIEEDKEKESRRITKAPLSLIFSLYRGVADGRRRKERRYLISSRFFTPETSFFFPPSKIERGVDPSSMDYEGAARAAKKRSNEHFILLSLSLLSFRMGCLILCGLPLKRKRSFLESQCTIYGGRRISALF